MGEKEYHTIRLEREGRDRLVPKDFFDVLVHKLIPVLSFTYITAVIGIAAQKGNILDSLLHYKTAYEMALLVVLWVSGPAIAWVFIKSSVLFSHVADLWYRIFAFLMTVTIMLSMVLFPEAEIYGLRMYFALSVPMYLVIYILLVKGELPKIASYPLNALGFCTLLYGLLIGIVF